MLSDWSLDERGQIRDDFADPALARGAGRKGGLVFANGAAAPLELKARPGARVRLRLGNAATARLTNIGVEGAKTLIVAVDGQPADPFEPLRNQFPMGPGARFELMFDMPREAGASVRFALRGDERGGRSALRHDRRRGRSGRRADQRRRGSAPIRSCRRRSRSKPRSAPISP